MRQVLRALLIVPLILCAANDIRAQQGAPVFGFARAPIIDAQKKVVTEVKVEDQATKLPLTAGKELKVRPNAGSELYLWVRNPTENKGTFIVELSGARGALNVRSKAMTIPGNTWALVALPKAVPPAPPAAAPPAAPAAAPPPAVPAPEPPPPGLELTSGKDITLTLLDKDGGKILDSDGNPITSTFQMTLLAPSDYVLPSGSAVSVPGSRITEVAINVKQKPSDAEGKTVSVAFPGSASVQLTFPPQDARKGAIIRDGFYRRSLAFVEFPQKDKEPSVNLTGKIEGALPGLIVDIGVDGIERAFKYVLGTPDSEGKIKLIPDTTAAVRISVANSNPTQRFVTVDGGKVSVHQPAGKFPIRIEVDNPVAGDTLEVRFRPVGGGEPLTEKVILGNPRDEHVWLETAGPAGGVLISARSKDWVKALDLANLQGLVEVTAVLQGSNTKDRASSNALSLMVDGTPAERVEFLPMPNPLKLEKGKPFRIAARANDPESGIDKAVFFIARDLDEGKMPADAIKGPGRRVAVIPRGSYVEEWWTADLKIPDDFRGAGVVGVSFTNQAGVTSTYPDVQRIEIADAVPKQPVGSIEGKILFGDRPQPGVPVSLRDGDGKEKGAATTNDKGVFTIKNVPPGNYTVIAAKKDSSTGASGAAPVQVEADKTAKVDVSMSKNRI